MKTTNKFILGAVLTGFIFVSAWVSSIETISAAASPVPAATPVPSPSPARTPVEFIDCDRFVVPLGKVPKAPAKKKARQARRHRS